MTSQRIALFIQIQVVVFSQNRLLKDLSLRAQQGVGCIQISH